jgi:membrane-bound lytic murein transglycosylase B
MFATELEGTAPAQLMKLEGANGPEYWVGFHNFYVITRYNRSVLYALAAFQLGLAVGLAVDAEAAKTELGAGITNATP